METFVPREVTFKERTGNSAKATSYFRYSLLEIKTPGERHAYFMTAYRSDRRREYLQLSPIFGSDIVQAMLIFRRIADAEDPLEPIHLSEVVSDLVAVRKERYEIDETPGKRPHPRFRVLREREPDDDRQGGQDGTSTLRP